MEIHISTCSICLNSLHEKPDGENSGSATREGPPHYALQCGHIFHAFCIRTWFENSPLKKCPVCQTITLPPVQLGLKPLYITFMPSSFVSDLVKDVREKTASVAVWRNKFVEKDAECRALRLRLEVIGNGPQTPPRPPIPAAHNQIQKSPMDLSIRPSSGTTLERTRQPVVERSPLRGSPSANSNQPSPPVRGRIVQRSMTMGTRIRPPFLFRTYEPSSRLTSTSSTDSTTSTTSVSSNAGRTPPSHRNAELSARFSRLLHRPPSFN